MSSAAPKAQSLTSINLTFLGTASAQPSSTRNHSALAVRLHGDVWLFDCGESTQHQLQKSVLKMGKIKKVFVTHTHGDHIFGLVPLLATRSNGAGGMAPGVEDPRARVDPTAEAFEIYGPLGTRGYVRSGLTYTHTLLGSPYVVHELRLPTDPPSSEDSFPLPLHPSELPSGRNIVQEHDGTWRNIFSDSNVSVSAAPILHSCPCVGYVIQEHPLPGKIKNPKFYMDQIKAAGAHPSLMRQLQLEGSVTLPDGTVLDGPPRRSGRKITILGDTYDPSPIADLAHGSDLLVHEATNSHLPGIDPETKPEDTYESVEERTKSRGHSTPQMAGAFANRIAAKRLVLNHFSARYKGDKGLRDVIQARTSIMRNLGVENVFGTESVASSIAIGSDASSITLIDQAAKLVLSDDAQAVTIMSAIRELAVGTYGSDNVICARDFMSVDVEIPKE